MTAHADRDNNIRQFEEFTGAKSVEHRVEPRPIGLEAKHQIDIIRWMLAVGVNKVECGSRDPAVVAAVKEGLTEYELAHTNFGAPEVTQSI